MNRNPAANDVAMHATVPVAPATVARTSARLSRNAMRHVSERLIESLLFAAAAVSVLTTVGIMYVLVSESIQFFRHVSLVDFLTDDQWTPLFDDAHYGIRVLVSGTLVSSADRKSTRLNSSHSDRSRMPSSA